MFKKKRGRVLTLNLKSEIFCQANIKSCLLPILRSVMKMTIGLPRALLYYRYHVLWNTFFTLLGCDVLVSEPTSKETLEVGKTNAVDENCLPLKLFLGHVNSLIGRCDYILVPRFARTGREEEFCVRFWGLPDLVSNTFRDLPLLTYSLDWKRGETERAEFIALGQRLGKGRASARRAYECAVKAQTDYDARQRAQQTSRWKEAGLNILVATQPYIIHDHYIGGTVRRMIAQCGGTALFTDRCDRAQSRMQSQKISQGLFWTMNKEMIGAIAAHCHQVDGVIMMTAFPCGTDSLVNELVIRKNKHVPMIQILLDEQQAEAGLETRVESFMDILKERRKHAGTA